MESCIANTCASMAAGSPGFIFTQLIQTLMAAQCSITNQQIYPADRTDEIISDNLEFDFIVAGGGSAGSVVASRLSEISKWKVLLIERGEDPSLLSDIPGLMLLLQNSAEDYFYKVEPDERFCQGMENHECVWAKGKALGGSSVINAMLHIIGNNKDYDTWASLGNKGWSYRDVQPYFRKMENYHPDVVEKYGKELFGTGGPLTLRPYNYSDTGLHELLLKAIGDLKLPILDMLNEKQFLGFGKAYGTIDNGLRQNVARAYLTPVKERENLYVIKSARVDSVILAGNKATGVRVTLKNGKQIKVKATKEVIVSAGTIASPQILMLSGIGPKNQLESHKIKVVADLPVGQNLQDHLLWFGVQFSYFNETAPPISPTFMFDWAYEYLMHRRAELSSAGGVDLIGFVNTNDPSSKYPNIEYHFVQIPQNHRFKIDAVSKAFNFNDELREEMRNAIDKGELIFACPVLINPKSVGYLQLKSANPDDHLKIHANYLDVREDVDTMLEALDVLRSFLKTETFKKIGVKLRRFEIQACAKFATDSKDYWECNLRHTAGTVYHPVGTCKMGPINSNDSVVDPTLKVRNIQKLRVIDASIMPKITSGNTHAPTLMIAEKGSDLIKQDWLTKDEL